LLIVGKAELHKIVPLLKENPDVKMTIAGHTDNTGNDAINQKLSENRANSVKN
jgi:outer membrane protein OmpA-like peptidoglycan-associated protein